MNLGYPFLFLMLIPGLLPLVGVAAGWERTRRHVLAREMFGHTCLWMLGIYYGSLLAMGVLMYAFVWRVFACPFTAFYMTGPGIALALYIRAADHVNAAMLGPRTHCPHCGHQIDPQRPDYERCPECGKPHDIPRPVTPRYSTETFAGTLWTITGPSPPPDPEGGFCDTCGYPRRGLPGPESLCPECGAPGSG